MACTESGNILIMTYAHARASGDGSLISRYVRTKLLLGYLWRTNKTGQYSLPVLTSWADYLSDYTLHTTDECVVCAEDSLADNLNDH